MFLLVQKVPQPHSPPSTRTLLTMTWVFLVVVDFFFFVVLGFELRVYT
jgi:hypothetical protein